MQFTRTHRTSSGNNTLYICQHIRWVFLPLPLSSCECCNRQEQVVPRVTGSRSSLGVVLPVPDSVHSLLPLSSAPAISVSFHVTPVFFNVGINEMASLAESLGATKPQERSNTDNFDRLNRYYHRFRKLNVPSQRRGQSIRYIKVRLKYLSRIRYPKCPTVEVEAGPCFTHSKSKVETLWC